MQPCADCSTISTVAAFYQQHEHEKLGCCLSNNTPNAVQRIHNLFGLQEKEKQHVNKNDNVKEKCLRLE